MFIVIIEESVFMFCTALLAGNQISLINNVRTLVPLRSESMVIAGCNCSYNATRIKLTSNAKSKNCLFLHLQV